MELLIFSDSHGRAEAMQHVMDRQIRTPDAVIFLGDGLRDIEWLDTRGGNVLEVRGNCDWLSFGSDAPDERTLSFEGHKLLLTHGHAYGVKGGTGALVKYAHGIGADIVLFGHTHVPACETVPAGTVIGGAPIARPIYLFNPGSVAAGSFGTLLLRGETVLLSHGSV